MANQWSTDPRYSHGYLVPFFSAAMFLMRRARMGDLKAIPRSWGILLLALGSAVQLLGGYYRMSSIEGLSILPSIAGLTLLYGGWGMLRCAWPSIAFLAFMVPLPWRVANALGPPLQSIATSVSTYLLQTLGFMAYAEGYVIQLNEARIGVVEACSGLSMVITFVALSTAIAMIVDRPLIDRIVLVISSIPVSLAANIFRITLTGILYDKVGGHAASTFYHDLAGWIMIPLALLLYWLEIKLLSCILIVESEQQGPLVIGLESQNRHLIGSQL